MKTIDANVFVFPDGTTYWDERDENETQEIKRICEVWYRNNPEYSQSNVGIGICQITMSEKAYFDLGADIRFHKPQDLK